MSNSTVIEFFTAQYEFLDEWFRAVIAERWRDGIKLVSPSWTAQKDDP
ncbi:hypothetical protein G6L37_23945 [Agrobacterium rubi]|nr:hypothetical protein [Agrobacterium rubi]NTF10364.1 hypothetical protein [Agrobacterium rubi]NTF21458.1 hypothetical protein [Agrobacterium rubi]NTF28315.1 hypothetical protein [Agrobacterium rubi]